MRQPVKQIAYKYCNLYI